MAVGAVCRHDASQEPGAVVPHAGICGGGGQQWLSLLRLKPLRCEAASQIKKRARMHAQCQMEKRARLVRPVPNEKTSTTPSPAARTRLLNDRNQTRHTFRSPR